jgi:predicted dehydrogenase
MSKSLQHRKIRWGIIGLGKIANKFATDLITINDTELYAVASRTIEKSKTFAVKYNAKKAYGSYEALVNDTQVDAVYIATPHSFHKENTILCLQHGIAVLCEKPLAMNTEEVMTMIAKSKENNVLLMEALWTYFLPHYQYVLDILNKREYGDILKLEADFGFIPEFDVTSRVFNKKLGGGSLLDIGIYPIFAALSTLGNPNSINADATFYDNGVDSSCAMVFNYNNGVKAFLKSTFLDNTPTQATIYCEKGTIKMNNRFHHPSSVTVLVDGNENTINFENKSIGYAYEIMHFNQLLRDGKTESDIMTFDFSTKLMQTLDEVREIIGLKY